VPDLPECVEDRMLTVKDASGGTSSASVQPGAADRLGQAILLTAAAVFVAISLPVVWRGALLADDFLNCMGPAELGVGGFVVDSWERLGAIRPARFLEILLTAPVCRSLPFGVAILVPVLLTLAVALLLRGLLRDLGIPKAWADIGGALWLFQPLGTEAGLWPAALHIPLGLALALGALRLYRRGHHLWAAVATLGAAWSVEQVILALPLAAWLVAPPGERRRAFLMSGVVAGLVIAGFLLWPGANPRLRAGVLERMTAVFANPAFYIGFAGVGLGVHSIPLAIQWALPWSTGVLAAGGLLGWMTGPRLAAAARAAPRRDILRGLVVIVALLVLANVPVVLAVPQQGSPRVFTPTWLVLAAGAAFVAAAVGWRRPRLVGTGGGLFAAGAILSLAFSVSVRLHSAEFTERTAHIVAQHVPEGGSVAICGVRRTVVEPAPRGAFAVHEFIYEWSAPSAVLYYTGRRSTVHLAGELWARPCPAPGTVDVVLDFDTLLVAGAHE
jgi:hypothetical protein